MKMADGVELQNPHLDYLETDYLYHLGLSTKDDLEKLFSDVRFVCMGGTSQRMLRFAEHMKRLLNVNHKVQDLTGHGSRFSIFKIGPVLSASHGMGCPSFSILLHELLKLLKYAKCRNITMIRLGTSGGVGVAGGTVVVSTGVVDDLLRENHHFHILGEVVARPCTLDEKLAETITTHGLEMFPDIPIINGKTMCATDFYESQGRLDGAFCHYDYSRKIQFLQKLQALGVRNIEMEASLFAAMCAHARVPAALVCVTMLNRLESDQMPGDEKLHLQWQDRPLKVVGGYISKVLRGN